ncbi:prepilin peptidase [Streptomyces sp. TRM S81-3]|uniref:Prepilin peptidase n=1 Tax=Streptomyces griseicoloratus TaxID=2752516 RepID=A0A926L881_9ACTN|nr:A24 family peptidase [Streptomyces griseicoloratus]MBD0423845.1 prepilin peptidase [Streptomyces griseicoloratus]
MSIELLVVAVAALWGAAAGAVLPRAAYRFSAPAGEDWRDRCPGGHPVPGWLGRARCGQCTADRAAGGDAPGVPLGAPRVPEYGPGTAALATVTALVCAVLAAATGTRPELAVWLLLAPVGVLLAHVDLRVRRLPDPLTLPLAGAALALLGLAALVPEHAGEWTTALLGALALGAGYFVLWFVNPDGMGFGDVKLALGAGAVLGWYGWPTLMLGAFAGFLLGALYGGALVVAGRIGRGTSLAFGPFLITGAYLGLLTGAYTA